MTEYAVGMTSTSSSPTAPRRNVALVTIDIIASVILLVFGLGIGLYVLITAVTFGSLTSSNAALQGVVIFVLMAVAVLGFFLAVGMVIVGLIRKRYTFWWPLAGIIVTVGLFYLGTWIISLSVTA